MFRVVSVEKLDSHGATYFISLIAFIASLTVLCVGKCNVWECIEIDNTKHCSTHV